jgi:hypothetical protein
MILIKAPTAYDLIMIAPTCMFASLITEPTFYIFAIPAVIVLGLAKGGFSGVGTAATALCFSARVGCLESEGHAARRGIGDGRRLAVCSPRVR